MSMCVRSCIYFCVDVSTAYCPDPESQNLTQQRTHTGGDPSIRHPALRKAARFQPCTVTANDQQVQQQQQEDEGKDRGGIIVMEVKDPNLAGEATLSVLAPLAEIVLEQREALMADRIGLGRRKGQGGAGG